MRTLVILLCTLLLPAAALASPGGPDLDPLKDRQHDQPPSAAPEKVPQARARRTVKRRTVHVVRTHSESAGGAKKAPVKKRAVTKATKASAQRGGKARE